MSPTKNPAAAQSTLCLKATASMLRAYSEDQFDDFGQLREYSDDDVDVYDDLDEVSSGDGSNPPKIEDHFVAKEAEHEKLGKRKRDSKVRDDGFTVSEQPAYTRPAKKAKTASTTRQTAMLRPVQQPALKNTYTAAENGAEFMGGDGSPETMLRLLRLKQLLLLQMLEMEMAEPGISEKAAKL